MHYCQIKDYPASQFKRLTGVRPEIFQDMLTTLTKAWRDFGRPPKLSREDQLLLALSYWREYRTLAHTAATYGVSEPTAWRIVRRVEDTLLRSGAFSLPGRRTLERSPAGTYRSVVLDATETEVERPQKSSGGITAARRSAIPSKGS
jgi:Helix-turn-helix of DDE superfamily endonuclease